MTGLPLFSLPPYRVERGREWCGGGPVPTPSEYLLQEVQQCLPGALVGTLVVNRAQVGKVCLRIGERMQRIAVYMYLPVRTGLRQFLLKR